MRKQIIFSLEEILCSLAIVPLVGQLAIEHRLARVQFELTDRRYRSSRGQFEQWVNC